MGGCGAAVFVNSCTYRYHIKTCLFFEVIFVRVEIGQKWGYLLKHELMMEKEEGTRAKFVAFGFYFLRGRVWTSGFNILATRTRLHSTEKEVGHVQL